MKSTSAFSTARSGLPEPLPRQRRWHAHRSRVRRLARPSAERISVARQAPPDDRLCHRRAAIGGTVLSGSSVGARVREERGARSTVRNANVPTTHATSLYCNHESNVVYQLDGWNSETGSMPSDPFSFHLSQCTSGQLGLNPFKSELSCNFV